MFDVELIKVELPRVGLPVVALAGVTSGESAGHEHDYIGNWLWDDGTCILWDDGSVIAL